MSKPCRSCLIADGKQAVYARPAWRHAHGEYFVVSEQASPRFVCRASSTFLQNHPRIARYVSNNCRPTTTTDTAINDAVAVVGYTWIVGGEAAQNINDYVYITLNGGYRALRWLTLSAAWDYQQAYVPDGDHVQSVTAAIAFRPLKKVRLRFYAKDYLDVAAYPDREYGGYVSCSF